MKTTKIGLSKMLTVGMPALFGTLLAVLVMTGCASAKPLVWDETLSDEECATVYFTGEYGSGDYCVTTYNGLSLGKKIAKDGTAPYTSVMKIPAGETTFTGVATININYNPYEIAHGKVSDVPVTYNFEAGKIYCVSFGGGTSFKKYEEKGHNLYFYIYDGVSIRSAGFIFSPGNGSLRGYFPAGDGTYITKLTRAYFYDEKRPDFLLAEIPVNIELNLPDWWKL